jgi:protoheme ferro-lyase
MSEDCQKKVRHVCARISFLMEHQEILPDLKEIASELAEDSEYQKGARDALNYLIGFLEQKGK